MVAGREVTPADAEATERLMRYWTEGPGAARINWGVSGDFDRCVIALSEHVGPNIVRGLCSNLHQRATGFRPGHAPSEQHSGPESAEKLSDAREFDEEWCVNTKSMGRVEIKDPDLGEVTAVFATLNTIDSDGDVTMPGAFDEGAEVTISAYGHQSWQGLLPVGKGTIRTSGSEAILDGRFFLNTTAGRETFTVVKELGGRQQWSYGYDPVKFSYGEFEGQRVRFLEKQAVHEVSPVLRGSGVGTRLLTAKSAATTLDAAEVDPGSVISTGDNRGNQGEKKRAPLIIVHQTAVVTEPWDTSSLKSVPDAGRPSDWRSVFAWCDPDSDPELKTSYRFAHHATAGGPANARAAAMGIAALNSPECLLPGDARSAAYEHLAAHMRDADLDPPELRNSPVSTMKFFDHGSAVLAAVSEFVDRATEVMALRSVKGKSLSPASAEILTWIGDELARLKGLLSPPESDDRLRDDELRMLMAAVASMHALEEKP